MRTAHLAWLGGAALAGLGALGIVAYANRPMVRTGYADTLETGTPAEARYAQDGPHTVATFTVPVAQSFKNHQVYYPSTLEGSTDRYPVIVVNNGTGTPASRYLPWFRHMASHGFIVIGNQEAFAWSGEAAECAVNFLLRADQDPESVLYGHVDAGRIGTFGHSQGGTGVINTLTAIPHAHLFKVGVALSPTNMELARNLGWDFDVSRVAVPLLMISGTGRGEQKIVVDGAELAQIRDAATASPLVVSSRRKDAGHREMLSFTDGYVTAWFRWHLMDEATAASLFVGPDADLASNPLYFDTVVLDRRADAPEGR